MREKASFRPLKNESVEIEWQEKYSLRGRVDQMKAVHSPRKKVKLTPATPVPSNKRGDSPEFPSYEFPLEPLRYPKVCIYSFLLPLFTTIFPESERLPSPMVASP
jgi:hypothetical protein